MAVTEPLGVFTDEKENGAIDMMVGMVAVELAETLNTTVEAVMPQFLQSRTCATLYDRESKLWWDGPSSIAEQYLSEIHAVKNPTQWLMIDTASQPRTRLFFLAVKKNGLLQPFPALFTFDSIRYLL